MDSLLCDEVLWLTTSPTTASSTLDPHHHHHHHHNHNHATMQQQQQRIDPAESCVASSLLIYTTTTKEDCEQAFAFCLHKELSYIPQDGYVDRLQSYNMVIPRFRVMQWLIKSRSRLNLSFGTVFSAANCLDRFLSMNQCHGWKLWMVELLSVACLSVASKFNETSTPTLHEIQMEDLDHSFQSSTIQRIELMLLSALKWRLDSTTAYSYIEMLVCSIDSLQPRHHVELTTRVTELLLGTLLDYNFLEFRPLVIALSGLKWSVEELFPLTADAHLVNIHKLLPLDQKDDLVKCQKFMQMRLVNPFNGLIDCAHSYYYPSSPVTVLLAERIEIYDCHVDLSVFEISNSKDNINLKSMKKRKREDQQ